MLSGSEMTYLYHAEGCLKQKKTTQQTNKACCVVFLLTPLGDVTQKNPCFQQSLSERPEWAVPFV